MGYSKQHVTSATTSGEMIDQFISQSPENVTTILIINWRFGHLSSTNGFAACYCFIVVDRIEIEIEIEKINHFSNIIVSTFHQKFESLSLSYKWIIKLQRAVNLQLC